MPVTPTYPGVYIEEVPSGVRTITGVSTSVTAVIGRTLRGPVNDPITINSFGDYERIFGGLNADSPVSYAVRDFYLNGGGQAVIVRLFRPFFATDADRETAVATATTQAQTAATAVAQAARNAVTATATPDAVAVAAETTANTTGTPGSVARAAATAVAQAARAAVTGAANAGAVRR
jgi:phage tail sheath protein FI